MTQIEIITPFGDTVLLQKSGQYTVKTWGPEPCDRYQRLFDIGEWLNKEWWPIVFEQEWINVEEICDL